MYYICIYIYIYIYTHVAIGMYASIYIYTFMYKILRRSIMAIVCHFLSYSEPFFAVEFKSSFQSFALHLTARNELSGPPHGYSSKLPLSVLVQPSDALVHCNYLTKFGNLCYLSS